MKNNPDAYVLASFKNNCTTYLNNIVSELSNHRGWWFSQASDFFRGCVGVIATMFIVPAIAVLFTKAGYVDTFFKKPVTTDSSTKFEGLGAAAVVNNMNLVN